MSLNYKYEPDIINETTKPKYPQKFRDSIAMVGKTYIDYRLKCSCYWTGVTEYVTFGLMLSVTHPASTVWSILHQLTVLVNSMYQVCAGTEYLCLMRLKLYVDQLKSSLSTNLTYIQNRLQWLETVREIFIRLNSIKSKMESIVTHDWFYHDTTMSWSRKALRRKNWSLVLKSVMNFPRQGLLNRTWALVDLDP